MTDNATNLEKAFKEFGVDLSVLDNDGNKIHDFFCIYLFSDLSIRSDFLFYGIVENI